MAAVVMVAVLALACPAAAFDPEATFAKGTMIFGLQAGGGVANNIESHRTLSDISFLNATPRVSYLLFPPFGSGLLRSALEPGVEGWFQYYLSPKEATAEGLKVAMRYHLIGFIMDRVALNVGYRFQHISNGHTSSPNRGFNSDTGIGGVSFYFK